MTPSVLIVDDHDGFRRSARALLELEGLTVVGEACDGPDALEQARRLRPDLVLLDVQLPGMDGFAVADEIMTWPDPPAVVLTSGRPAAAFGPRLAGSPARGFLAKNRLTGAALAGYLH